MKNSSFNKRIVLALATSLLAVSCFAADDPGDPNTGGGKPKDKDSKQMSSSSVKNSEKPIPRIWIGLTGSYTPLKLLSTNDSGSLTDTLGNIYSATGAQGQVGGGATVNARIYGPFWLSVGAIYRFTGYDSTFDTSENGTGVLTNVGTVVGNIYIERSRVRLIDFPVMVRYTGKKWNAKKYTFYEAGGAVRDSVSRMTVEDVTNVLGYNTGSVQPFQGTYHRMIYGAMAGAGITAKDDFGIIVSPEVRYTRWMGDTFNYNALGSSLVNSTRNQLEVTVSFGF